MSPRSSIEQDPRVKEAADEAIRNGATIDQIVDSLQALGADISRSAVGRYTFKTRAAMAKLREVREVARVWADKFGTEPDGDVGQLVSQVLHALAYQQASQIADSEPGAENAGPREVNYLAGALRDIASAQKISADRVLKVRKETATKAVAEVDKVAKQRGLSPEAVAEIRAKILGVVG